MTETSILPNVEKSIFSILKKFIYFAKNTENQTESNFVTLKFLSFHIRVIF